MNADPFRFDAATNPYGCSPKVVEAMVEFARSRQYRLYGEESGESLRENLATHLDLSPENFMLYNGAGEALVWLFIAHLVLRPGRLMVAYPSYERFVMAGKRCAAEVVEVPLENDDFSLSVERFIETSRRHKVSVGLLSNPNNPSGNLLLDAAALSRLLEEMPECLWIVDEAYGDYAGVGFASWVEERKNLVVLRTFSKAYGLAGLRVGYAVAHPSVIQLLVRLQIPWVVDSMALVAAQAALEDQEYLDEVVAQIRKDCGRFYKALKQVPYFHVYPSAANFFLVRLENIDPVELKDYLERHNIRVRRRPDMPQYMRFTSLTEEENQYLLDAVRRLI